MNGSVWNGLLKNQIHVCVCVCMFKSIYNYDYVFITCFPVENVTKISVDGLMFSIFILPLHSISKESVMHM